MRSETSPLGGQNLDMQTPDITSMNLENIAKLFPNVITEKEENGKIIKAIDFDILKQELSKELVEDNEERYVLNWPGKKASLLKANTPINKTLRPCREDSVDFDKTENLYIEGDNFEVLKILQESYLGKVKMIYIDPPYNTGKDFVYRDKFAVLKSEYEEDLGVEDEEGGKLFKNTDTNGRFHSDWLSMMYERLTVARDLLKDDGVIFMSIDDNEVHNLRKIADEIFGEENFVADFVWQKNFAPKNDNKYISISHENIFLYSKSIEKFNRNLLPREEKHNKGYNNPDNDKRGIWTSGSILATTFSNNGVFEIISPNGNKHLPPLGRCWRYSENKISELLKDNKLWFGKDGNGVPRVKRFLTEMPNGIVPQSWLKYEDVGSGQDGTQLTKSIFGNIHVFDFPKPIKLLNRFLTIGSNKNDIILDFFSGSATTAHAVMGLNAEDGGNRKFVMVQIPEETDEKSEAYKAGYKNICEIGKERIRRAGKKIIEENKEELEKRQGELSGKDKREHPGVEKPLDTGFRVYKTDSSNMKDVFYHPSEFTVEKLSSVISNIKEDRSSEDLLTQVILDLGLTLDMPIEKKEILGNTVYFVAGNSLVACFDENIDFGIVDEIAKEEPLRVVFRDNCFKTDSDRINFENRFKKISGESDIRVI